MASRIGTVIIGMSHNSLGRVVDTFLACTHGKPQGGRNLTGIFGSISYPTILPKCLGGPLHLYL